MKKLIIAIILGIIIIGCPPQPDEPDDIDTDTTFIDTTYIDTTIIDTTITDTTVIDTTVIDTIILEEPTDITIFDTTFSKDRMNKYETFINIEKKFCYFQLHWACPSCGAKKYTDYDFKKELEYQKFTRRCLKCGKEYKIKRNKNFYEIKEQVVISH